LIDCFDISTAHLFGDALAQQFRLRHRVFIDRIAYDVPSWCGMEYDQYDTPATTYLVWRDPSGEARGVARLNPTDRPYMVKDLWPDLVTTMPLPQSQTILEATRFGVDKTVNAALRRTIVNELVVAHAEFAILRGVTGFMGSCRR
jgi:acyl homoserine lactone synthase